MKTYQDWCVETIKVILGMKDLDEGQFGYKMIVKDIIRHYPEVFIVDGQQEHFWTKAISQGGLACFRQSYMESFIMSQEAYAIVIKGSVDEIRSNLYQEHITPVQYIFDKLEELRKGDAISLKSIRACMAQNKLVLLHVSEKNKLDGGRFSDNDLNRLREVVSKVEGQIEKDAELNEAKKLIRQGSKWKGSGLFRLCKLLASGIQFRDRDGNECSDECLVRLLLQDFKKEYITS